MESKPHARVKLVVLMRLLLEPVWNRNTFRATFENCYFSLLLEPVWNRNVKRGNFVAITVPPFNRTSMESKRRTVRHHRVRPFPLLIEPVWNRNL